MSCARHTSYEVGLQSGRVAVLCGVLFLSGIGFTMSLFIAMLAFDDMALVYAAERGIIAGSPLAGIAVAVDSAGGPIFTPC